MSETSPGSTLQFTVRIDYTKIGGALKLKWYYNNIWADHFQIRVPKQHEQIKFCLDDDSNAIFKLIGVKINQYERDGVLYKDLVLLDDGTAGNGDGVIVRDSHIHNAVPVGAVTLIAKVRDEAVSRHPELADFEPNDTFQSDPEILNTGNET